jgi:dGTP triphosphohydrolase
VLRTAIFTVHTLHQCARSVLLSIQDCYDARMTHTGVNQSEANTASNEFHNDAFQQTSAASHVAAPTSAHQLRSDARLQQQQSTNNAASASNASSTAQQSRFFTPAKRRASQMLTSSLASVNNNTTTSTTATVDLIKAAPQSIISEQTAAADEHRCIICLDSIQDEAQLDCCKHLFCFTCIYRWGTDVSRTIPMTIVFCNELSLQYA